MQLKFVNMSIFIFTILITLTLLQLMLCVEDRASIVSFNGAATRRVNVGGLLIVGAYA
jgi:aspartate 1-decarboxylase